MVEQLLKEVRYKTSRSHIDNLETWILYPLLLQRCLEGCTAYEMRIDNDYLTLFDIYNRPSLFAIGESIDQAKEAALMYVREQEKTT